MPGIQAVVLFTNTSTHPCAMTGWPRIGVAAASTEPPIHVSVIDYRVTGAWGPYPPVAITLAGGDTVASSVLMATPVDAVDSSCNEPFSWLVTPPGTNTSRRIPESHNDFGICTSRTSVVVSPVHRLLG